MEGGLATATGCSEMRHDPILDKWVIISPARGKRPTDFKSSTDPSNFQSQGPCAFCLNHEHECAPEIFRIPEGTSAWMVRVIKNLYPALSMDHESTQFSHRSPNQLHITLTGFGSHDVVIETPEHSMTLANMPESSILRVLIAYKVRVQQLASNEIIKYIQVFKNHGVTAGASMRHSHSQIIGLPIVPTNVERRLNNAREYFNRTGKCNLCECLSREIQSRCRFIEESAHFIAFVPYAASLPFETWIAPKEHASHYQEIKDEQAMDLAYILKHILQKLDHQLANPPYNYMIHSSPLRETYERSYCHWFIQIVPQLTRIGGFEIASGCYINPIFPENVATILREVNLQNQ